MDDANRNGIKPSMRNSLFSIGLAPKHGGTSPAFSSAKRDDSASSPYDFGERVAQRPTVLPAEPPPKALQRNAAAGVDLHPFALESNALRRS
jgi:hypothetical protein